MASRAELAPSVPATVVRQSQGEAISSMTLRGGAYLAVRYGLGVLVSIGNMLVLTWWIGPRAYGLFVTALGPIAFLCSQARVGVDTYLVRREVAPDNRVYGIATTLITIISVGLSAVALAVAPLLVRWFGSREFLNPYLALVPCILVTGLAGVPTAMLERAMDFRGLASIELAGQCVGLVLSVTLAYSGYGIWAPVAGQLGWQLFILGATSLRAQFRPRLAIDSCEARGMLAYGVGLTASLRTWQLRTLINPLLVGRFAGAEAVAYVAFAIRAAEALGSVRLAAGRLAIAALARLQHSHEQFRGALERALYLQVVTLGPLLCGFALCGPWIMRHVVGARWLPSLAVYPFIAAGVLINSVFNLQASALFVLGRQWLVMRSYVAHVVILGMATGLLLPRLGIAGYGWAEMLSCAAYLVLQTGLRGRFSISYRKLVPWSFAFLILLFVPAILPWTIQLWRLWFV